MHFFTHTFGRKYLHAILLSVAVLLPVHAEGQQRDFDNVAYAERVLRVFYPELFQRKLTLKVRDDTPLSTDGISNWFSLEISEPWVAGTPRKCDTPDVASAYFQVTHMPEFNRIRMAHFGGPATLSDRLDSLRERINQNPRFSDDQILKLLRDSGAKYLPNNENEVVGKVPLKELEEFLGRITVREVRFDLRDAVQLKGNLPAAELSWTIYITAEGGDGKTTKYFLIVEPFEAKVQALERIPLG